MSAEQAPQKSLFKTDQIIRMDEQLTNKNTAMMADKVESDEDDDDNVFLDDDGVDTATSDRQRVLYDMVRSMEQSIKESYNNRESVSDVSESSCHSPSNIKPLSYMTPCSSSDTVGDIGCPKEQRDIFLFGGDLFHTEREFIDYLMSLPSSKTESTTTLHQNTGKQLTTQLKPVQQPQLTTGSGNQSPKVGLDHLENLCKLMEQLGELREQNCKLQKRVQYLEEMRCLNEMRKDLKEALDAATALSTPPNNDQDRDNVDHNFDDVRKSIGQTTGVKLRKTNLKRLEKQRGRSQSMELAQPQQTATNRLPTAATSTALVGRHYDSTVARKAKVSKWTKVKEALKWERASQVDTNKGSSCAKDAHHSSFYIDDDDDDKPQPLMVSKASVTLRSPATKTQSKFDAASGPILHPSHRKIPATQKSVIINDAGEVSAPYFFSRDSFLETSSEEEDDNDDAQQTRFRSADKRQSMGALLTSEEPFSLSVARRQSSPIRCRTNVSVKGDQELAMDRKGRSLDRNVDPKMLVKHNEAEKESMRMAKTTWGRMKNIIQARKDSLKRRHRKSTGEQTKVEYGGGHNDDDNLGDDTWDVASEFYCDAPGAKSKHSSSSSNYGAESNAAAAVILLDAGGRPLKASPARPHQLHLVKQLPERSCGTVQISEYSPTSFRKSKWTKVKKVFLKTDDDAERRPHSDPTSPTNPAAFYYDDIKFIEDYLGDEKDWGDEPKSDEYATAAVAIQRILAEDKSGGLSGEQSSEVAFPLSTDARRNLEELQRNISHDFCKKLEEWEKLRSGSNKQLQQQQQCTELSRKGSNKTSKVKPEKMCKHRDKELQWLQKQLQKIEREKLRLAKERQKYLEREARLERMKETMMKPPPMSPSSVKNEVLIKTSAGEFRFEGISQTFTRKLYEWEAMKGIGPEVSTIALLDSQQSYQPQRSQSVKNVTPVTASPAKSHNTLNSLSPPSVRYGRLARSRSRSDSSIADIANVQTSTTSLQVHESLRDNDIDDDGEIVQSRATSEPDLLFTHSDIEPPCAVEVEELHYEEFVPCTEIPALHIEEPVYSYTPSEVIHLIGCSSDIDRCSRGDHIVTSKPSTDQSANKDDICRRLESELKDIDGQMKIMFQKQAEEIREDDERQLELLGELRTRIQEIEKASEIIKDEPELVHSDKRYDNAIGVSIPAQIDPIPELPTMTKTSRKGVPDKLKMTSKKKEGVVKIQSLSSELLQQAKALEEALLERNATIRKLQWELVQRDMTTTSHQEPGNPTEKTKNKSGNHAHSRSWSSADETYASHRKTANDDGKKPVTTNHKPPSQFFGSPSNPEVAVLPVELTRKVRELKTELMRLWSSGDSSTSEQGSDEKLPCPDTEIGQDGTYNCLANKEEHESLLINKVRQPAPVAAEPDAPSFKSNISVFNDEPEAGNEEQEPPEADIGCSPKQTSRRGSARSVIARRVSDTAVPTDGSQHAAAAANQSELVRQRRKNLSRLPRSPDVNSRVGSKIKPDQAEENVLASPKTPTLRLIPRSPLVLGRSHVIPKPSRTKDDACDKTSTDGCSRATTSTAVVESSETPKLESSTSSSSIPIRCSSNQNVIVKGVSPSTSTDTNSSMSPKRKTWTSNEKSPLQRQNAEEVGSSSDTDTEGSGVTFTIDIGRMRKHPEKPERRFRMQAPVQKPPRTFIRRDVESTVESSATSPPAPPHTLTTSCNRRPSKEETKTTNCDVTKFAMSNLSNLPTPTRFRRTEINPPITSKPEEIVEEPQTESGESKPGTPVVKSRSTRKLKMPSTTTTDQSPLVFRKGLVRSPKEPAPNVRMMVEKFNMKIVQEQHSPSASRSPLTCLQRRWISSPGVQKSNSFREPQQTSLSSTTTFVGDTSVVKSASASTVEGSSSRFPQSPTFSAKCRAASLGQQPVGIASRIPRCLKSILEQDSGEAGKESPEIQVGEKSLFFQNASTRGTKEVSTISKASNSSSPSSSPSSATDHVVYPMTPPTTTKLPVANKQAYSRFGTAIAQSSSALSAHRSATSAIESPRPNAIVPSSPETTLEESTTTLMKSASAGMVEGADTRPTTSARSSEDLSSPSKAPQLQKGGMFNFKFRKAKLKQKKEPLNTVKALCRQSLVVDIHGKNGGGVDVAREDSEDQTSSRTIPISSKSCPSSPESQSKQISKSGGWLTKPKILFKSK